MTRDLTVIYYTNQRENPKFEGRIRKTLWRTIKGLRIPLISVSQKPIDFGLNICIGEHESSDHNAMRQIQIGAERANTTFVAMAEADYVYPREYFEIEPEDVDIACMAVPVFVLISRKRKKTCFMEKRNGGEGAMVVGRKCLISTIESTITGRDEWDYSDISGVRCKYPFNVPNVKYVRLNVPCVSFKTDSNMHAKIPTKSVACTEMLSGYGSAHEMVNRYFS